MARKIAATINIRDMIHRIVWWLSTTSICFNMRKKKKAMKNSTAPRAP
jgi:hypothetical protein